VIFADGQIRPRSNGSRAVSIIETMRQGGLGAIEEKASAGPGPDAERYSHFTHSAVFAEVRVDHDLAAIRVMRVVRPLQSAVS
jgi:xanthine dehydrogenase YagR molybdenum-binding subunit